MSAASLGQLMDTRSLTFGNVSILVFVDSEIILLQNIFFLMSHFSVCPENEFNSCYLQHSTATAWVSPRISKKNNFNLDCIGVSPVPGVPARSWTMVASHSHTCSSHISPCYISLIDHYSQPYNGPSLCKYNENVSDKVLSRTPHLPAPRGEPGEERMQFTASLRDLFDRNYKIIKCTSTPPPISHLPPLLFPSCIILTYPGFNRIQSSNETSTSSLF